MSKDERELWDAFERGELKSIPHARRDMVRYREHAKSFLMKKRVLRIIGGIVLVGLLLGAMAFAAIVWQIHRAVQEYCSVAQKSHPHPGDNVAALVDFMNSDSHSFRERNFAIWTLGRLRDPKALPALESVYTGAPCDHDKYLCQYGLEKAIKLCGGEPKPPREKGH